MVGKFGQRCACSSVSPCVHALPVFDRPTNSRELRVQFPVCENRADLLFGERPHAQLFVEDKNGGALQAQRDVAGLRLRLGGSLSTVRRGCRVEGVAAFRTVVFRQARRAVWPSIAHTAPCPGEDAGSSPPAFLPSAKSGVGSPSGRRWRASAWSRNFRKIGRASGR